MRILRRLLLISFLALLPLTPATAADPLEVRVVIVTAFEIGDDSGDRAGEFQAWATITPDILPFPAGYRHLRYDPASHVLLLSTGIGTNRAATSTMALGQDPRFDLTHAYWMIAAIAGADPNRTPVGSAVWVGDVVDTDYGYAIDPREAPKGWTTGMFPRDRSAPYQGEHGDARYNLFPLNKGLRDWAFARTGAITIPDQPALRTIRAAYRAYPAAQQAPLVLRGAEASGQTFWHGALLNSHVEKWVDYWTGGKDQFLVTAMEDTGVINALAALGRIGRADPDRLLVLRTASNFSVPPAGTGAAESLAAEAKGLSALQPSLDAAFLIGLPIVTELAGNWSRYRDTVPGGPTRDHPVSSP